MEVFQKGDEYIRIEVDPDPVDWRKEGDCNIGTMVCWHGNYILGDEQPKEEPQDYEEGLPEDRIQLPLYLYDHSGITMSTEAFGCPWDSGQVGFIYTTPAKLKEMGIDIDKAEECLKGEVKEYDRFLRGAIYGFTRFKKVKCPTCGNVEEEEEEDGDSCWGFSGSDHEASGLLDSAGITDFDEWEEVG